MTNDKHSKSKLVPLDIARETFKQMAMRRVEPTPDNYQIIYSEIEGVPVKETLESAFKKALKEIPHETTGQSKWINRWDKLLKQTSWTGLPALLTEGMDTSVTFSTLWPDAIRDLLQAWNVKQVGLDLPRKKESLERVLINFGNDPLLAQKIQAVASGWMNYGTSDTEGTKVEVLVKGESLINKTEVQYALVDSSREASTSVSVLNEVAGSEVIKSEVVETDQFQQMFRTLQDLLKQSLSHGLIPRLDGYPELKAEAQHLSKFSENARKLKDWQLIAKQFRALLVRVELIGANEDGLKEDLLSLLKLLIDNIGELVADDQWIRGQIAVVQTIIDSPLERVMIKDAEKSLKEVIFKQGTVKHSLTEAKSAFKNMVSIFVDRLSHMTSYTGNYHEKVESYASQLTEAEDIAQISTLLENLMKDTHAMQTDIVRSRDDMLEQRGHVESAQEKILKLQEELSQLSEKVSIDQLTGVLNRRGLDEAMMREISRAQRGGFQLSVALLDIDNFKHFNDTYGHHVGDTALQHLAKVIQETVRPTDIAARFGGEEFVILLPDTSLDQAVETISRLQRALTKRFFLGNNERLLITFSAGVALFKKDEDQAAVLNRADQAMYLAKKIGKNRVMTEFDLLKNKQQ